MNEAGAMRANLTDLSQSCHRQCTEISDGLNRLENVLRMLDFPRDEKPQGGAVDPITPPCVMSDVQMLDQRLRAINERLGRLGAKFEVAVGERNEPGGRDDGSAPDKLNTRRFA